MNSCCLLDKLPENPKEKKNWKYCPSFHPFEILSVNPLTPVSDQDIISPYYIFYNIMQTSDEYKERYQLWDY